MTLGVECHCATLRPAPASPGPLEREVGVGVEAEQGEEQSPRWEGWGPGLGNRAAERVRRV